MGAFKEEKSSTAPHGAFRVSLIVLGCLLFVVVVVVFRRRFRTATTPALKTLPRSKERDRETNRQTDRKEKLCVGVGVGVCARALNGLVSEERLN